MVDDFGSLMDVLTIHIDALSIGGKLKEQTDGATDAFHVTLSRSCSRHGIRLLRDFDKCLFTQHPSEHLHQEDARLEDLDSQTRKRWEEFKGPTPHQ